VFERDLRSLDLESSPRYPGSMRCSCIGSAWPVAHEAALAARLTSHLSRFLTGIESPGRQVGRAPSSTTHGRGLGETAELA